MINLKKKKKTWMSINKLLNVQNSSKESINFWDKLEKAPIRVVSSDEVATQYLWVLSNSPMFQMFTQPKLEKATPQEDCMYVCLLYSKEHVNCAVILVDF